MRLKSISHLEPSHLRPSPTPSPNNTSTFHCSSKNIPGSQALYKRPQSNMTSTNPIVAVLYQALPPPMYDGVSKPPKPGGKNILEKKNKNSENLHTKRPNTNKSLQDTATPAPTWHIHYPARELQSSHQHQHQTQLTRTTGVSPIPRKAF